ncbi:MAG: hypothetical protein WD771_01090 [Gemmatimonadaceae bacterium]
MTGPEAERSPSTGRTRKLLHLSVAAVPLCWGFGLVDVTTVRVGLAVAVVVALTTEYLRRRDPVVTAHFDARFGRWLKPHERAAITGATWLACVMLAAVLLFPAPTALVALWAGTAGDAAAALIGGATRRATAGRGKSLVGALACMLATALGAWLLGPAGWAVAGVLGVVAAAAEWPARLGDDNLRVTLATGAAAWLLGVR